MKNEKRKMKNKKKKKKKENPIFFVRSQASCSLVSTQTLEKNKKKFLPQ